MWRGAWWRTSSLENGCRPQLLEHLAELFPRQVPINYGRYRREERYEAARLPRACPYLEALLGRVVRTGKPSTRQR